MRLLVIGGRNFSDAEHVTYVLDKIHEKYPIDLIIHGRAGGADMLADHWAAQNGIPVEVHTSNPERYGKAADPVRNTVLIGRKPDAVLAFPGGKGTAVFKLQARSAGLQVLEPPYRKKQA